MKKIKQKVISTKAYVKKMTEIIAKGHPVADTLIELLEEASKYQLKEKKK